MRHWLCGQSRWWWWRVIVLLRESPDTNNLSMCLVQQFHGWRSRARERERWQQKLLNCRDKDFSPIWPYIMNEVIARLIETAMTGEATYLLLSLCPSSLHPGQSLAASFGRYTTCPGTGSLIRRREWCSHNMSQYGTICQNPILSIHPDSLSMEGLGRPFFSVFLVWVFQPRPAPEGAVDITLLAVF